MDRAERLARIRELLATLLDQPRPIGNCDVQALLDLSDRKAYFLVLDGGVTITDRGRALAQRLGL
jgi:hypothetical protein